jgi:hypothetical protein
MVNLPASGTSGAFASCVARASNAASDTISANVYVDWDTEDEDTDTAMSAGVFTCPASKAGLYLVSVVRFGNSVAASLYASKNNANSGPFLTTLASTGVQSGSTIVRLAAGDTLGIKGDAGFQINSGVVLNHMSICRVG